MDVKIGDSDKSPKIPGAGEKHKRRSRSPIVGYVEEILEKRLVHGKTEYLVKWKEYFGGLISHQTWEPEEYFHVPAIIADFEKNWKINEDNKDAAEVAKKRGYEVVIGKEEQKSNKSKKSKTTVKEPDLPEKTGFDRGLQADKIIGATRASGELMYLIKWKNSDIRDYVPARQAYTKCPHLVVRFYEGCLFWYNKSRVLTVSSTEN